jgi:hypothetical protein
MFVLREGLEGGLLKQSAKYQLFGVILGLLSLMSQNWRISKNLLKKDLRCWWAAFKEITALLYRLQDASAEQKIISFFF